MNGRCFNVLFGVASLVAWIASDVSVSARNGPRIVCRDSVCEFGRMDDSQAVDHTFVIRNDGDSPLEIVNVRGCCGATTELASRTIPPGSNTAFKVSFSLRGRKGEQRKSMYIGSNDSGQPYLQLRFVGTVTSGIDVRPGTVDFGRVSADAASTQEVSIVGSADLTITNVVVTVPQFAATHGTDAHSSSNRLSIWTVPPLPSGVTRGEIHVFTDSPKYSPVVIAVAATVSSELIVVPQEIRLTEEIGRPEPVTCFVAIRSREGKPFKVLKVETPDSDIKAEVSPLDSDGYRCELKGVIPFADLDGKKVVIRTDMEGTRDVTVLFRVIPSEEK